MAIIKEIDSKRTGNKPVNKKPKSKKIEIKKDPIKKNDLPKLKNKNSKAIVLSKNNKIIKNTEATDKPKKKKRKRSGKIINFILSVLMLLGIGIMGVIIVFCAYIVMTAPEFDTDKLYNKEASIFYYKDTNTGEWVEFARVGLEQREPKSYDELPQVLIDALVATEDSRFFQHNGFDVVRFVKASFGQVVGEEGAGGASTLTMQVAKNTFSKDESGHVDSTGWKGIVRKFQDIYMSIFLIEKNYTKEEIIEFYVNAQFLGQNTYGVEQASQKYFGKSVQDLTLTEAALLVGIFNAPSTYNPFYSTELSQNRRDTVLNLMLRHGYITEEQAADAKAISVESLIVEQKASELNRYQQFIDVVCNDIEEQYGKNISPYTVSMDVYTTMNPTYQGYFMDLNEGNLGYKWKTYKYNNYEDNIQFGGVITSVKDGSVVAVDGGRHQKAEREFSRATMMKRQPGSTAKPIFAYGPYIEYNNGNTGTVFYDNPMTYSNGQKLTNADKTYYGAMTMRQALAKSRNIPAVQAFQAVDKDKIAEFVKNLGIDYYQYDNDGNVIDTNLYESYAIGGGVNVSPRQMSAAYAAFARGGYYIKPYTYTKLVFKETDEVYEHKYEKVQVMSEETAYLITDILITATKQGAGGNINVPGTEIASKTGTSTHSLRSVPDSASADNWVLTYSPDYCLAFWYGVDNITPTSYTDAIAAAVQRKIISAILADKIYPRNSKFNKPAGVVSAKYELETNPAQLPSEFTPGGLISTELFKKGTEPSEVSDRFSQLANPTGGSADISNSQINLSWREISTPNAISSTYLQKYFEENYGKFSQQYLDKRYEYNNSNIGTLGYQIFLQTEAGQESLGFTSNPYFVYNAPHNGTYTFIVKSAYSIFKDNMSSGLTIRATVTNGIDPKPVVPEGEETEEDEDKDKDKEKPNNPLE